MFFFAVSSTERHLLRTDFPFQIQSDSSALYSLHPRPGRSVHTAPSGRQEGKSSPHVCAPSLGGGPMEVLGRLPETVTNGKPLSVRADFRLHSLPHAGVNPVGIRVLEHGHQALLKGQDFRRHGGGITAWMLPRRRKTTPFPPGRHREGCWSQEL